jgi:hypothetical protein
VLCLRLTDHQPLALALELIDLDSLKEILCLSAKNRFRDVSKAAREISNWHNRAIDVAIVTSEEEEHVVVVCNDSLVNGTIRGAGRTSSVERLCCTPATRYVSLGHFGIVVNSSPVSIGGVVGRPVAERSRSPLVAKNPDLLGCKVEQSGRDSRALHVVLAGGSHVGPVFEDAKVHRSVRAVVDSAAVHEVLPFVRNMSEIFERSPVVHG